jgi:hypothetical protein
MALSLDFALRLEDRSPDRVLVSVLLAPRSSVQIDGVALQLFSRANEAISARVVMPIAGELTQPMLSTIELRAFPDEIPLGSRVVGTAWAGPEQREATVPTDTATEFERHVRARCRVSCEEPADDDRLLERLSADERSQVARLYPWVDEPRVPKAIGELEVVEHEEDEDEAFDDLVEDLGIDEESAEWLKDLLAEES